MPMKIPDYIDPGRLNEENIAFLDGITSVDDYPQILKTFLLASDLPTHGVISAIAETMKYLFSFFALLIYRIRIARKTDPTNANTDNVAEMIMLIRESMIDFMDFTDETLEGSAIQMESFDKMFFRGQNEMLYEPWVKDYKTCNPDGAVPTTDSERFIRHALFSEVEEAEDDVEEYARTKQAEGD